MFLRTRLTAVVLMAMAVVRFAYAGAAGPSPANRAPVPVRLLDVPYVPQSGALCGGAALAMVLRHWGEPAVLAEDFAPSSSRGARASGRSPSARFRCASRVRAGTENSGARDIAGSASGRGR